MLADFGIAALIDAKNALTCFRDLGSLSSVKRALVVSKKRPIIVKRDLLESVMTCFRDLGSLSSVKRDPVVICVKRDLS